MKKILLGLGTLGAIVAPIASVISCDSSSTNGITITGDFTEVKNINDYMGVNSKMAEAFAKADKDGIKEVHFKAIFGKKHFEYDAKDEKGKTDAQQMQPFVDKYIPFANEVLTSIGLKTIPEDSTFEDVLSYS